ncbi:putative glucosylceramidase 3 [Oppia nitens]|uniref:putative glucosylceramidase 3 n=1 Tax=Oppia nitens TaxID=1686743 RepID=UPI0023D99F4C|nr:putative glucosylceramidase 3 [Oppia nitens]
MKFGQPMDRNINGTAEPVVELYVKVNREIRYQQIFGFGGAFTDSTGINVRKAGEKLGDQILRDYFSSGGLEYNVGRIPIGGSDFSSRAYSLDDSNEDRGLRNWSLAEEDLQYKIPIIQKAKQLATHDIRLFGSPWSAPKWMKTNNELIHGGSIKGPVGSDYWQIWAKYFVKYLDAYKAHNISHWGITIQNEPQANQKFNSMLYTPEQMRDFLAKTLGPELDGSGYGPDKLSVMIWDHNLDYVQQWVRTIFADPVASRYAAGTAVHWYSHSPHELLDEPHRLHPDKFILATEACVGGVPTVGAWSLAERYAEDILGDLLHHVVGWTDWNMVLDNHGGPSWVENWLNAPIIFNQDKHEYYRLPHYYALAHFSKFLSPGSVRIDSQIMSKRVDTGSSSKVSVGAFRTPDNSTVVIVVNNDNSTVQLTIDDPTRVGKLMAKCEPKSIETYANNSNGGTGAICLDRPRRIPCAQGYECNACPCYKGKCVESSTCARANADAISGGGAGATCMDTPKLIACAKGYKCNACPCYKGTCVSTSTCISRLNVPCSDAKPCCADLLCNKQSKTCTLKACPLIGC